jgi:hypothetical protein
VVPGAMCPAGLVRLVACQCVVCGVWTLVSGVVLKLKLVWTVESVRLRLRPCRLRFRGCAMRMGLGLGLEAGRKLIRYRSSSLSNFHCGLRAVTALRPPPRPVPCTCTYGCHV